MRNPATLLWPDNLAPVSMTITIDRPVFKGPKPLDGREQVVSSGAGGWLISYENIPVYGNRYRQLRSIWLAIGGFARPIYVKPEFSVNMLARRNNISALYSGFDPFGVEKNTLFWGSGEIIWGTSNPIAWGSESASDFASYEDGSFFSQSTGDCVLAASAARGATTISVTNSTVSQVEAGDYIELDGRLHVVQQIFDGSWNIWPPLRSSYAIGTVIEIDDPRCLAYLVTDSKFLSVQSDYGRVSRISVDFIEANW